MEQPNKTEQEKKLIARRRIYFTLIGCIAAFTLYLVYQLCIIFMGA